MFLLVFYSLATYSCTPHIGDPGAPVANCDDMETDFTLSMDWTSPNASQYDPGFFEIGNIVAPFYHGTSPAANPSAASLRGVGNYYYCKISVTSACSRNGGSQYNKTYLWTPAGANLQIKTLLNEDTQIKLEYYMGCERYGTPSSNYYAHPYYIGVLPVKKGATQGSVKMTRPDPIKC